MPEIKPLKIKVMNNKILIVSIFMLICSLGHAQKTKQVLLASINSKYEGETKKGLANGEGKAWGETDIYEGEFKKGYPHGDGSYVWGNGNKYTGEFSKGEMDGKGELTILSADKSTSKIQKGYFKDDEYIGLYEDPYKIISEGGARNVHLEKKAGTLNELSFEVFANGAQLSSGILAIRDKNNTLIKTIAGVKTMTDINFPLEQVEVSFRFDNINYKVIFDLYQEGTWKVVISV